MIVIIICLALLFSFSLGRFFLLLLLFAGIPGHQNLGAFQFLSHQRRIPVFQALPQHLIVLDLTGTRLWFGPIHEFTRFGIVSPWFLVGRRLRRPTLGTQSSTPTCLTGANGAFGFGFVAGFGVTNVPTGKIVIAAGRAFPSTRFGECLGNFLTLFGGYFFTGSVFGGSVRVGCLLFWKIPAAFLGSTLQGICGTCHDDDDDNDDEVCCFLQFCWYGDTVAGMNSIVSLLLVEAGGCCFESADNCRELNDRK